MPPRAQKRKLDDSPYALSGIKRTNLTSSSNGLYPREPRDRDASGYTNAAALSAGRGGDYYDKYSGLSSYERDPINPAQASKRRKVEAAGTNANTYYATGGGLPRGEEGPQITLDLSTLPHSAILKYLQMYNLTPAINPPAISVQRPSTPHMLLKSPSSSKQQQALQNSSSAARATPGPGSYGRVQGSGYWEEQELQDSLKQKTVTTTATATTMTKSGLNGISSASMYTTTTTSVLGLSAANLEVEVQIEHTALYDADEARNTLTAIAQGHWNSMSSAYKNAPSSSVYGGSSNATAGNRLSEREVIDEFMLGLRAKELAIRLTV